MVHALYEKERRALHSQGQSGQTQPFLWSTCDEAASTRKIWQLGAEYLPFVWKQCRPSTGKSCPRHADESAQYAHAVIRSHPILKNRPVEANCRVALSPSSYYQDRSYKVPSTDCRGKGFTVVPPKPPRSYESKMTLPRLTKPFNSICSPTPCTSGCSIPPPTMSRRTRSMAGFFFSPQRNCGAARCQATTQSGCRTWFPTNFGPHRWASLRIGFVRFCVPTKREPSFAFAEKVVL